ncbi:MAG: dienelactone hydrolase family protein [Saprospiraceae bacterium]|nr:dienelactone hydrolase family protein [Saprospiraceae bacterium]
MKKLIFLAVLALSACQYAEPASDLVMCHDPNNALDLFAAFAGDPQFRSMHPDPASTEVNSEGAFIQFPVEGGPDGRGFLVKAAKKTNRYLLLFHEWWGVNDYIKNEAAMWSKELKINVLAVDLYDGKVASTSEEAGKLMQANDAKRSSAIVLGAAKHLGEKANFRTMGWCFGGGWSLQASLLLKEKSKACVMFYGMPEKDVEKLKQLQPKVLFVHAMKDKWINDEVVATFETNMKAANKSLTVSRYDADHAFANPSSPRYNETNAKQARDTVKSFLKSK